MFGKIFDDKKSCNIFDFKKTEMRATSHHQTNNRFLWKNQSSTFSTLKLTFKPKVIFRPLVFTLFLLGIPKTVLAISTPQCFRFVIEPSPLELKLREKRNPFLPAAAERSQALIELLEQNRQLESRLKNGRRISPLEMVLLGHIQLATIEDGTPPGAEQWGASLANSIVALRFPRAHTGAFISDRGLSPEDKRNPVAILSKTFEKNYHKQGIAIYLPGNGGTLSVARSVAEIASLFHKGLKNRGSARAETAVNPRSRLMGLAVDLAGNGFAMEAPADLLSPEGTAATVHHIRLLLAHLYGSEVPVFIVGRSYGASVALEYSRHYQDVAGVVAANPFLPDPRITRYNFEFMVHPEFRKKEDNDLLLHPSYEIGVSYQNSFSFMGLPAHSPELILTGERDLSFANHRALGGPSSVLYFQLMNAYAQQQPDLRIHQVILGGEHMLFSRTTPYFKDVVASMDDFYFHNSQAWRNRFPKP